MSGKNPEFLAARCGECHASGELTDATMSTSNQLSFGDFVAEFIIPGVEILVEPLGRSRMISSRVEPRTRSSSSSGNAARAGRNARITGAYGPSVDAP